VELQEVQEHQLQYLVQFLKHQLMEKVALIQEDILQVEVQELNKTLELNLAVLVAVEMRQEQVDVDLLDQLIKVAVVELVEELVVQV
tara:strand:- start:63 stop:323 length:261 start_codon:yes stop_codon:yes gene_type:complete